ncbi:unnamed protein product [Clavelina lepadiformis]|uniref:Uncharacterized protein n=1 Tax=Clavelina lepadiformis TaxID=159417 RepID=A0ABP0FMG0_CLALP
MLDGDISSDEKSKPTPISLRRSARKRHAGDDNDEVEKKKQKPSDEKVYARLTVNHPVIFILHQ